MLPTCVSAIGLDLVEVARIRKAMANPRFTERILTPRERALQPISNRKSAEHLAGRWAAKEAVAKAVGLQLRWHDVEVLPDRAGRPVAHVHHSDFPLLAERVHLTISHTGGLAAAVAVVERQIDSDSR